MRKGHKQDSSPSSIRELIESISTQVTSSSQYTKFQRMYARDRIAFVYDCMPSLGKTLAPYQEEMLGYLDDGYGRLAIRGPHGLGKTALAAVIVHHSVLTCEEDGKTLTTASAWRQLEKYLWPEIHKFVRAIHWPTVGRDAYTADELFNLSIRLRNSNVEAFALASDDHTALEGAHATNITIVFDEAKAIPAPTWDALEGAFSTEGLSNTHTVQAFAISTPGDPSGRFYDIHSRKPGYTDWYTRHVTIDEAIRAGRVSKQWMEMRIKQWGVDSAIYKNRVLGEFADVSDDGIIPLSWINIAVDRWQAWKDSGAPPPDGGLVMGVDVARMGQDATVMAVRRALTMLAINYSRKNPATHTAGLIKTTMASHAHGQMDYASAVNIEGDALGASVYDILREQGMPGLSIHVPGSATSYRDSTGTLTFINLRSAIWWNMRELLDPGNGYPIMLMPDDLLIGDLSAPRFEPNSRGQIQVESKDQIRKRLGRSTDAGDACCYCYWQAIGGRGGGVVF